MRTALFKDRCEAGRKLARRLRHFAGRSDLAVLALPRGGVPVAFEVALASRAPLDVFVVRKVGVPESPELAMGAIASGGILLLNEDIIHRQGIAQADVNRVVQRESVELARREGLYQRDRPTIDVKGKTVILVDDGLATGWTMRTAVVALWRRQPAKIIVAVPVASPEACRLLENEVDEVVCAAVPDPFDAVGRWYGHFDQTTDDEVCELLHEADRRVPDVSLKSPAPSALRSRS